MAIVDEILQQTIAESMRSRFINAKVALLLDLGHFDEALKISDDLDLGETGPADQLVSGRLEILSLLDRWDDVRVLVTKLIESTPRGRGLLRQVAYTLGDIGEWELLGSLVNAKAFRLDGTHLNRAEMLLETREVLRASAFPPLSDLQVWKDGLAKVGAIDGFYHNYAFSDGTTLFDIAPIKTNSPVVEPDFNFVEWRLIQDLGVDPEGKRVLDIGSADGFFSVQAMLGGASSVVALDPDCLFAYRVGILNHRFGGDSDIKVRRTLFDRAFGKRFGRYDLVFALGLIYHFNNLYLGLANLCEISDRIVIETETDQVAWQGDQAALGFRDGDPLDFNWVRAFFAERGYSCRESVDWANYVDRFDRSRGRRLAYFEKQNSASTR